jgi:hypothetical protein
VAARKPLVEEAYVVTSDDPGRPVYLCRNARGQAVTPTFANAQRFDDFAEADQARRVFADKQHGAHHGPRNWRVIHAATRTVFKET